MRSLALVFLLLVVCMYTLTLEQTKAICKKMDGRTQEHAHYDSSRIPSFDLVLEQRQKCYMQGLCNDSNIS